jgi:hypothetical protein
MAELNNKTELKISPIEIFSFDDKEKISFSGAMSK